MEKKFFPQPALRRNIEVQPIQEGVESGNVAVGVWSTVLSENDNVVQCPVFTPQVFEPPLGKQVTENRGKKCMPCVLSPLFFHLSSAIREKI